MPLHPELNLDGLPGPTHGFAGLSYGNLASTTNRASVSNPRAAALQALEKMQLVASLGVPQGILPPLPRPDLSVLRVLGFTGTDERVVGQAAQADPDLLLAVSSASAMWTANAATICPSADSEDGRVHITTANLAYQFHRSIEAPHTQAHLKAIFPSNHFTHHAPLPSHASLGDEGAANHIRLGFEDSGVQIFVYGPPSNTRFPARQTSRASESIARLNRVHDPLFLEQSPAAIDAGAFHNDVVAVGSADVLLTHERAFVIPISEVIEILKRRIPGLTVLSVTDAELPLKDAVSTYLFNSQLVPVGEELHLIAPTEVRDHPLAVQVAERLVRAGTRLTHVHYVNLRQSMRNGGGPACVRLRVPLRQDELTQVHPGIHFTPALYERLKTFIIDHYREALALSDLKDPRFAAEVIQVQQKLMVLLDLST